MITVEAAVLYGVPILPGIFDVSVYDTKSVHFFFIFFKSIIWFQKTCQLYEHKTEMVCDAHFLWLNLNDSYNHNINLVDLSGQLPNVFQVGHWMRNYKWWWSFSFGTVTFSLAVHKFFAKHFVKRERWGPWNIMSFGIWFAWQRLTPQFFSGENHLVLLVQRRGIKKKDCSTMDNNVSKWLTK